MGRPASAKREALIAAAAARIHRVGLASASLADIARDADVPPGNVYYYFRAKQDLARSVQICWAERLGAMLAELERQHEGPWDRLRGLLDRAVNHRADYAAMGCPLIGLARDLRLSDDEADAVQRMQLNWIAAQFEAEGIPPRVATGHAQFLLASLQGSFQLAHAARDGAAIAAAVDRLKDWLTDIERAPRE